VNVDGKEATTDAQAHDEARVRNLSNDALIIELINTLNHLSRWLTPIHDRSLLVYAPRRSERSVKDVLLQMRDTDTGVYALMNAIATQNNPDLDQVPRVERTPVQIGADRAADPLVVMSEFRRVRESATALLRALPDSAWERGGYSRRERNWTIRELAADLALHDRRALAEVDRALERIGARHNITQASRVRYEELLAAPVASAASR
jgi:hypothetical protein